MARQAESSVDVFTMTPSEYHDALTRTLAACGLTYSELERQARTEDFTEPWMAGTWALIRGTLADGRCRA